MSKRKALLVLVCLTTLVMPLLSCAPSAPPASPKETSAAKTETPVAKPAAPGPTPTAKEASDQPRSGGVLRVATIADPPHLDVHMEGTAALMSIIGPAYSCLLQYDPLKNEQIIPDLAEKWEVSPDGKLYTFFLRKNVKWHDGKPFSSVDAKFSLERLPKFYARKRDQLMGISQVEAPDDLSVKVAMQYPSAGIVAVLAQGTMPMAAKHFIEAKGDMKKEALGTGPFKLKDYSYGISLEVTRYQDYYVTGRPYLNRIIFYIVKDKATRFAAFRTGQVKLNVPTARFSPIEAKALRQQLPEVKADLFEALTGAAFFMNMTQKPWDDVRIRRAVHLATDRQAALKVLGDGEGTPAAGMIAGQWAIPEDELKKLPGFREPKDADIAEAKRLLSEAGVSTGLQARMLTRAGYADYLKVAEFMTDQLGKIGIRGIVDAQETAIYTDRLNRTSFEGMASTPTLDIVDPDAAALYFVKGNRYGITDEKLYELFDKQGKSLDPSERKRIVLDMQLRVLEVAPYVFNIWLPSYIAFWPEVKNFKAGIGNYNNNKYQDVWLAK